MAEKQPSSLIGYDPLAWLSDGAQENLEQAEKINTVGETSITELSESSVSLVDNQEDELVVAEEVVMSVEAIVDDQISASQEKDNDAVEETIESIMPDNSIVLPSIVNIQGVAQLHQTFIDALEHHSKLEIDASAVSTIDTATLQLLLVLKTTAIKNQKDVSFEFPSDRFIESARLIGLEKLLDLDHAAAGFF